MTEPAKVPTLGVTFLPDAVRNETLFERLLEEFTGVLSNRELRLVGEMTAREVSSAMDGVSPTNPAPSGLVDAVSSARLFVEMGERWLWLTGAGDRVRDGSKLSAVTEEASSGEHAA